MESITTFLNKCYFDDILLAGVIFESLEGTLAFRVHSKIFIDFFPPTPNVMSSLHDITLAWLRI